MKQIHRHVLRSINNRRKKHCRKEGVKELDNLNGAGEIIRVSLKNIVIARPFAKYAAERCGWKCEESMIDGEVLGDPISYKMKPLLKLTKLSLRKVPPVTLKRSFTGEYWIVDGRHRVLVHILLNLTHVRASIE